MIVVGVKQDQVALDAELAQLADAFFKALKELRIEATEVPFVRRRAFVRENRRRQIVSPVGLGENAHAQFIERRRRERFERLLLELLGTMRPGVRRGSNLLEGRAVGVGEMIGVVDANRSVISRL